MSMYSEEMTVDLQSDLVYTIKHGHQQKQIIAFLQSNISECATKLTGAAKSDLLTMHEDDISRQIVNLLNDKLREKSGYLFRFEAKEGPDILIFASPYKAFSLELFVVEAKRLPPTSNQDYVKSGIGRFKKEKHGKGHGIAAMLGYVQKENFDHWYNEINSWIEDLIATPDGNPSWIEQDKLHLISRVDVGEYRSTHSRINENPIILHHFWVSLFNA